jgi:hypothetical protein
MVIRIRVYDEDRNEEHEVTTVGDFLNFYSKILDLANEQVKNERKDEIEKIGLGIGRLRTLLYTNNEIKSKESFGFEFIFYLIEKEILQGRIKLTKNEKGPIRTKINRIAINKNDRLERIDDGIFRLVPEEEFSNKGLKELV